MIFAMGKVHHMTHPTIHSSDGRSGVLLRLVVVVMSRGRQRSLSHETQQTECIGGVTKTTPGSHWITREGNLLFWRKYKILIA